MVSAEPKPDYIVARGSLPLGAPVEKQIDAIDAKTVLADRLNMLYASTFVTYGRGKAVVAATGDATEVGQISELITTAEDLDQRNNYQAYRFPILAQEN